MPEIKKTMQYALAPAPAPAPAGAAVHESIDSLEQHLNELESVIGTLVARLEPVAGDEPPEPAGSEELAPYRVPVANRIDFLRKRVAVASHRVYGILGRLEV